MSLLEEHPAWRKHTAELDQANEAAQKFMTDEAARRAPYDKAVQEWNEAALAAAVNGEDAPPEPEPYKSKYPGDTARILMQRVQQISQQRNEVLASIRDEVVEQAQAIEAEHRPEIARLIMELEESHRKPLARVLADVAQVEAARANANGRRFVPPQSLSLEDLLSGRSVLGPRSIETRQLGAMADAR